MAPPIYIEWVGGVYKNMNTKRTFEQKYKLKLEAVEKLKHTSNVKKINSDDIVINDLKEFERYKFIVRMYLRKNKSMFISARREFNKFDNGEMTKEISKLLAISKNKYLTKFNVYYVINYMKDVGELSE